MVLACYAPGNKKPARGGLGEEVEFTDFQWYKFWAMLALAAVYNFWIGFRGGPPRQPEQPGKEATGDADSAAVAPRLTGRRE